MEPNTPEQWREPAPNRILDVRNRYFGWKSVSVIGGEARIVHCVYFSAIVFCLVGLVAHPTIFLLGARARCGPDLRRNHCSDAQSHNGNLETALSSEEPAHFGLGLFAKHNL